LTPHPDIATVGHLPDNVSIRRWFAFYGLFFAAGAFSLFWLLRQEPIAWPASWSQAAETLRQTAPAVKLIAFTLYISLACTFLPLPTTAIVAAVATRSAAVTGSLASTALLVGLLGAAASTLANLNDYHLFTWLLRSHHVSRVRNTRGYLLAARWFARAPFFILVLFNFIPIPVDVIRMLATTAQYPRLPFAAANFLGRFVRYGIVAGVTYCLPADKGWIAVVVLLALAVVLGAFKVLPRAARRLFRRGANGNEMEQLPQSRRDAEEI